MICSQTQVIDLQSSPLNFLHQFPFVFDSIPILDKGPVLFDIFSGKCKKIGKNLLWFAIFLFSVSVAFFL